MRRLAVAVAVEDWPWTRPLLIAGHRFTQSRVVVVRISVGGVEGWGEAIGVFYSGETADSLVGQIESVRDAIEAGIDREMLRAQLPPGGARNALDCALWDLEAKQAGQPVWQLARLEPPRPILTTYTIGADSPATMAATARDAYRDAKALKLKLLGDGGDAARVTAIRAARPDIWIGVDANQSFSPETLQALLPALQAAQVSLIEQPFKIGAGHLLDGLDRAVPFAADESVQSLADLDAAVGRFDIVNIKLDKSGGLTEALLMARRARELGLRLMVGNMGGTSLAMAPALLLAPFCDIVDLDGPLFLAADRSPGVVYDRGFICPADGLWGGSA